MDIGRAFSYLTEDQDWWKKVLIGGLLSLIPIVGPFYALGYVIEAMKNVIDRRETPLPEVLENFGGKLVKGIMLSIVIFIYFLPFIIISGCSSAGSAFPALLADAINDEQVLTILTGVWSGCFGCIALIYAIFVGLLMPFVFGTYADTGQFGAALQVGKIFGMFKNKIGPAFIALLVNGLAAFLASLVGSLLCGIGFFFTMFYAQLVMAFLYGSVYREAKATVL